MGEQGSAGLSMQLDHNQRGVLRGIVLALVVMCVVLPLPLFFDFSDGHEPDRRQSLLLSASLLALPLTICIAAVARFRFFSPVDIHGNSTTAGSDRLRVLQAVLQNTLEQTVLAALVQLTWTQVVADEWLPVANMAAGLFLFGRLLFATGYANGAPGRAFGFALTFYPSVVLLVGLVVFVIQGRAI
jgi:uncharacterized membrane protein YecN with MAPEG domain